MQSKGSHFHHDIAKAFSQLSSKHKNTLLQNDDIISILQSQSTKSNTSRPKKIINHQEVKIETTQGKFQNKENTRHHCCHHHPCQANFVHLNLQAPITMQEVIKSCAHVKDGKQQIMMRLILLKLIKCES